MRNRCHNIRAKGVSITRPVVNPTELLPVMDG